MLTDRLGTGLQFVALLLPLLSSVRLFPSPPPPFQLECLCSSVETLTFDDLSCRRFLCLLSFQPVNREFRFKVRGDSKNDCVLKYLRWVVVECHQSKIAPKLIHLTINISVRSLIHTRILSIRIPIIIYLSAAFKFTHRSGHNGIAVPRPATRRRRHKTTDSTLRQTIERDKSPVDNKAKSHWSEWLDWNWDLTPMLVFRKQFQVFSLLISEWKDSSLSISCFLSVPL